ncbi:PREDICTED: odorant receptor 67a-like [Acromyrmex echinatior]|uniref:odorant receptor 67a-like n=1 Tax=Acromyrmex echinatior TaxID=103372 RepID=UPI000580E5D4|nr:PREDICTED: odorant receptor 67a-like [Acromyrmex echinatior]
MEWTLERAELYEKNIYQRYVDRCAMFYVSSTAAVFLGAGIGVIVPLTAADQIFPTEAKYPFNVEHEPIKTIIFVHQFIAVWQCFSTVCIGSFVSLFIWFAAARFEILLQQFRMVTDIYDITVCVRQHIKLLRYAQEIIIAFRSVLLTIMIICTWAIVASGLTIVSQCSLTDKIQFMALCISALMEVYACAWPADRLIDTSTNVAQAVYESLWYNQDKIFQKNLNFILLRSQTPTTISVSILPPLSLQYYASYLISEMEHNIKCAQSYEKKLYQRYVDRCAIFYVSLTAAVFLGASITATQPFIAANQIFPTDTKYPFDVEYEPVKTIIFLHQFIVIWQCFSIVCMGSFVGLLIWFAAARFEILSEQFRMVTDIYGITVCVRQHVKLLR